jgi:hypothetical protein
MSFILDKIFIDRISPRLDRFKWKSEKVANARCPLCGDSHKSKLKARAYFYRRKDDYFFTCHNCLLSMSFSNFLKEFDSEMFKDYIFEKFKTGKGEKRKEPKFDFKFRRPVASESNDGPAAMVRAYTSIADLPDGHFAKDYVVNRRLPEFFHKELRFVPDFKKLVDQIEPTNEYSLEENEPRLVIPFYDEYGRLIAFQGRSFSKKGIRYITIKVDKSATKIFGLDRVDKEKPVYAVEGPFDSLFIPNAIATAGASVSPGDLLGFQDLTWVFDNERRNYAIIEAMKKMADKNHKVCVWPDDVEEKDINAMVLAGRTPEQVKTIIDENTYKGLSVRIALREWKRC